MRNAEENALILHSAFSIETASAASLGHLPQRRGHQQFLWKTLLKTGSWTAFAPAGIEDFSGLHHRCATFTSALASLLMTTLIK
jgi:hypothetical protein